MPAYDFELLLSRPFLEPELDALFQRTRGQVTVGFVRDELLRVLEAGELALPPAVSIARRIIEAWYGGELPDGASAWLR